MLKIHGEGMRMKKKATVSSVIALLLLGGVLALLPTPAWAPTETHLFSGQVISISAGDGAAGAPWSWVRVKASNTLNENEFANPDVKEDDRDKRF